MSRPLLLLLLLRTLPACAAHRVLKAASHRQPRVIQSCERWCVVLTEKITWSAADCILRSIFGAGTPDGRAGEGVAHAAGMQSEAA